MQELTAHEICFVFYILRIPLKSMKTCQFKSNVLLDLAGMYQQALCFHRYDAKQSVFSEGKAGKCGRSGSQYWHPRLLKALQTKYIYPSLRSG